MTLTLARLSSPDALGRGESLMGVQRRRGQTARVWVTTTVRGSAVVDLVARIWLSRYG
ncbi:hypothetical protein ACIOEW_10015 [Streptomyces sp. NPDC087901]|uniref:hypothetical protein n=1 Tax=Streptomyces sp. NPDC087901 TaxID=3365818 RepID=UPI0038091D69